MSTVDITTHITAHELAGIAHDIWSTFVGHGLEQVPEDRPLTGETMTGCVHLSGSWEGTVFLEVSREHARAAAEAMFAAPSGSLSDDDIGDALGELTNMVAGNVKSVLLVPTQLSMPTVTTGFVYSVRVPGATLVERALLAGPSGHVRLTVTRTGS